ncbi:homocysteine S-methyltransferase family protein [bacterium]|nr:homocysteine S-methyltransferase family protein [bacterium]RQV94738.1 MAG: homocysteine S-methyltransferase family protein [bacterium]
MSNSILNLMKERVVLLDGGMGTELIRHGFPKGTCPEIWNVEKSEIVRHIHKDYFEAGSDAVLTNSFGGNKIKLASYGLAEKCYELNMAAATIANEVKPAGKWVAGSIGPTGQFLHPVGKATEANFEEAYVEQVKGLVDGKVDFLLIETQYDIKEALCALRTARKQCDLPVFVTMTYNRNPKGYFTMMGNSMPLCVQTLEKEDIPALGANCTLDSRDMTDLIKAMRKETSLPLIAQANAGQPSLSEKGEVTYTQDVDDYMHYIPDMLKNGANIIGGCCGTNPDYIKRMAVLIKKSELTG